VCQNIVPKEQIRLLAVLDHRPCSLLSEELDQRRDALFFGDPGDISRRFDPEHRHSRLLEVLQQVAVVAGELDYQRVSPKTKSTDHLLGVGSRMCQPGVRE
jgi:hypothetical protein